VLHHQSDVAVIRPTGGLDLATNAGLHELLRSSVEPARHVLFDFGRVASVDSGPFAVLGNAYRRAATHQARIAVAGAHPTVRDAVELLCLHRVLPMFDDQRDALRWLRGESRAGAHGRAPGPKVWVADAGSADPDDASVGLPSGS
jgi:anti-anti-sigma factor